MKYNRLTDLGFSHSDKHGKPHHLFLCDCGNKSTRDFYAVKRGATKSCGCSKVGKKKHGMNKTRIYQIWSNMLQRMKPSHPAHKWYYDKGITCCERWNKFENFYEDMKEGYSDNLTIDRIDNNKGYFKENCRWATLSQQQENSSNAHSPYTWNGKTMMLREWAEFTGIPKSILQHRIGEYKWTLERAFTQKVIKRNKKANLR